MLDINGWEFVLLVLLAIVLVGPKRLPDVARTAARWLKAARSLLSDARDRVREEFADDPLAQEIGKSVSPGAPAGGWLGGLLADDDGRPPAPRGDGQMHWDSEAT